MNIRIDYEDEKYLDGRYPVMITPRLLMHRDSFIQEAFRREFRHYQPELFSWKWSQGDEVEIGGGTIDQFKDPANYWINQKYRIGTGRIVESVESSTAINYVELGGGFRLHYAGYDPVNKTREFGHVLLLDWLFLCEKWEGKKKNDGAVRLRKLLKHLEQMPGCPYHTAILCPVGCELLDLYSPHLEATGYQRAHHTTTDLKRLYGYWLKTVETKQLAYDDQNYHRCCCFAPIDPIYDQNECPYPLLMENA